MNGAGDAIAALFLFHRLNTGSAVQALEAAGSSIHGLLRVVDGAGAAGAQARLGLLGKRGKLCLGAEGELAPFGPILRVPFSEAIDAQCARLLIPEIGRRLHF